MTEIQSMELGALVDMLSEQTAIYTRLLAERSRSEEFEHSKTMIKLLQQEIKYRRTEADLPRNPRNGNDEYSRHE